MGAVSNAKRQIGWVSGSLVSNMDDSYLGEAEWNGDRIFDAKGNVVGYVNAKGNVFDVNKRPLCHIAKNGIAVTDTGGRIIGYVENAGLAGSMDLRARGAAARLLLYSVQIGT